MKYSPIDYYRSVRIIEESSEGDITTFKVSVDVELFSYKTEEEIADMIYKTIQNALKGYNMAELYIFCFFMLYFVFIDEIGQLITKLYERGKKHGTKNESRSVNSGTTTTRKGHKTSK